MGGNKWFCAVALNQFSATLNMYIFVLKVLFSLHNHSLRNLIIERLTALLEYLMLVLNYKAGGVIALMPISFSLPMNMNVLGISRIKYVALMV